MYFERRRSFLGVVTGILMLLMVAPATVLAEPHVVNPAELQQEMLVQAHARRQNFQKVQQFLSSPQAQRALQQLGADPQQVNKAVAGLNDSELADLASRTQKVQANFAAGSLSDRDLILVILGLVALILIIVAVR
jgi:hypothetical protein